MSQPVRATLAAARVAPIPPGARSALLMQHGSMKLRYYAPRGAADLQTPHDQDELYVIASGRGTFLVAGQRVPFEPGDVLFNAMNYARTKGVLAVVAAGNDSVDNDTNSRANYPSSYDLPNIVSVTGLNQSKKLASFSNWGFLNQ